MIKVLDSLKQENLPLFAGITGLKSRDRNEVTRSIKQHPDVTNEFIPFRVAAKISGIPASEFYSKVRENKLPRIPFPLSTNNRYVLSISVETLASMMVKRNSKKRTIIITI